MIFLLCVFLFVKRKCLFTVGANEIFGIVMLLKLKAYAAVRTCNYATVATVTVVIVFATTAATAVIVFVIIAAIVITTIVVAAAITVAVNLIFENFKILVDLFNILLKIFAIILNAVKLVGNVGKDCKHFGNYLSCFFFLVNTESLGKTFYICNLFADCHNIHLALSRPFSF